MLIAGLASFLQTLFSQDQLRKTVVFRNCIAVLCTAIAVVLVYETPNDIIPVFCIACSRFGETFSRTQHIKLGYAFSASLWIQYSLLEGLYFFAFIQLVSTLTGITTTWVEEQKSKSLKAVNPIVA